MNDQDDNNNANYTENSQSQLLSQPIQNYDKKAAMREKQIKRMYNPVFVAAFLIILWPFGLYYMWKGKVYNKTVRIIISILISILVFLKIIGILAT